MSLELVRLLPYNHPYRYDGTKFGGPKLWTPSEVTTVAWYDAYDLDTITGSGDSVSQWDDKSGNNRHLTQGVGADQPSTGISNLNSLNVITGDGVSQFLAISNAAWHDVDNLNVFTVAHRNDSGDTAVISNRGASSGGWLMRLNNTSLLNAYIGSSPNTTVTTSTNDPHIYQLRASETTLGARVDGGTENAQTTTGYSAGSAQLAVFRQGSDSMGDFLAGDIGEIILYDGTITDAIREKIEGYLAHKWGLDDNLPGGHTYKNYPPTI